MGEIIFRKTLVQTSNFCSRRISAVYM